MHARVKWKRHGSLASVMDTYSNIGRLADISDWVLGECQCLLSHEGIHVIGVVQLGQLRELASQNPSESPVAGLISLSTTADSRFR